MHTTFLANLAEPTRETYHVRLCQIIEAIQPTHGCILRVSTESVRGVYSAEQVNGKRWQVVAIVLADRHRINSRNEREKLVLLECPTDPDARWTIELDRLENYFAENRIQEV